MKQSRSREKCAILLPVSSAEQAAELLPLAEALATIKRGQVVLVGIIQMPEGASLSEGAVPARQCREGLRALAAASGEGLVRASSRVRVCYHPWRSVREMVRQGCDLLLFPWDLLGGDDVSSMDPRWVRLLSRMPIDLALVRWRGMDSGSKILLPIRGGKNAPLAMEAALAMAEQLQGEVTLLHATPGATRSEHDTFLKAFTPYLRGPGRVTRSITAAYPPLDTILEEASAHEALILGAGSPSGPGEPFGQVVAAVARRTTGTLLVVKRAQEQTREEGARRPVTTAGEVTPEITSILVDTWFAENTFHSDEFADLASLVDLKERAGQTISLGLPTLNEERTIGAILKTVKEELMERFPLVDEIAVVDSGSEDRTTEIAADAGVSVYCDQQILPQYGNFRGKGENLWKSLYVLKGDIVVWVDTDVSNFHPRFIYGLIGPLLLRSDIQYVKGFYERPVRVDGKLRPEGGGRVTELAARPLMNLFFPELSGLVQPLSGEYAGRREALERVPFFSGYGVEIGLLIDILDQFGLRSLAQVDLQTRIHRNKPLVSLSKMAFAIIQVVIQRLEKRHKFQLLEEINRSMKLIRYDPDRFYLEVEDIADVERPPMIALPEYRRLRGIEAP